MLDLRSPRLAFAGKIAKHSFTNSLRFAHHLATANTRFFHTFVCLALRLDHDLLTVPLPLCAKSVGGRNSFDTDGVGLAISAFASFGRGAVGCVKDLSGLYPEYFSNPAGFESILRDVLNDDILLDQSTLQFVTKTLESADLRSCGAQTRLYRSRVEAAPDQREGNLLKSRGIDPII